MELPFTTSSQEYRFAGLIVTVMVPDPQEVQDAYNSKRYPGKPYWTAVWPSAEALCRFIAGRPELFREQEVWEVGAGLGLPSLLVAHYAGKVIASDLYPAAVELIRQSAAMNQLNNLDVVQMDWNCLPSITAGIVLLADVNYDPLVFDEVSHMLGQFIQAGCRIILATPARISSGAFMTFIQPYIRQQHDFLVNNIQVAVFTLDGNNNIVEHHRAKDQFQ